MYIIKLVDKQIIICTTSGEEMFLFSCHKVFHMMQSIHFRQDKVYTMNHSYRNSVLQKTSTWHFEVHLWQKRLKLFQGNAVRDMKEH